MRFLSPGESFKVDEKQYRCEEVQTSPLALVYSVGAARYTLRPEKTESTGAVQQADGTWLLQAKERDPNDPTTPPKAPESEAKLEVKKDGATTKDPKKPARPNPKGSKAATDAERKKLEQKKAEAVEAAKKGGR